MGHMGDEDEEREEDKWISVHSIGLRSDVH